MDASMYAEMAQMEKKHWWFVGRRAVVFDVLRRHGKKEGKGKLLDIGLGTGFNANLFLKEGYKVHGLDPSEEAIQFAKTIAPSLSVIQAPFPSPEIPSNAYDVAALLDVVEHLEDDTAALREVHRLLTKGGIALITVPAFMFLWTKHDERAHHFRRYRKAELGRVIRDAGLEIELFSYYNFFLFPAIVLVRFLGKLLRREEESDFDKSPGVLNGLFASLFASERFLLRHMTLPFGVSLIALVRKP